MRLLWLPILIPLLQIQAQNQPCVLKDPIVHINFGSGDAAELNTTTSYSYRRVEYSCPTDGHYTYTPYTSDCFRGDWITLPQDHTEGDILGNMLLVNASYRSGEFFSTMVRGLSPGTKYEFAVWMLNVCKPSEKCPFPLLPNITIQLETVTGQAISRLHTGELERYGRVQWTKYSVMFTVPQGITSLALTMVNHNPGGCGNDFAVDDITFRECVPPPPPITKKNVPAPGKSNSVATKPPEKKPVEKKPAEKKSVATTTPPPKKAAAAAPVVKKTVPPPPNTSQKDPVSKPVQSKTNTSDTAKAPSPVVKAPAPTFRPPPPALTTRTNDVVKKFETAAGEIRVDLYDNGEIDGDTVTIYHNNSIILSRARLSQNPLTLRIAIDANNPHHELVMVANNLGSIPPNTSLMIVTVGSERYEVFISSNEQRNAKVVFDLKK